MEEKENRLLQWSFEVEEISAGVYRVRGVDDKGHSVESIGTDADDLLKDCKHKAEWIVNQLQRNHLCD